MQEKRHIWIKCQPRLYGSDKHIDYKFQKRIFRREYRKAQQEWERTEYEQIEKSAEIDQNTFWHMIKKKRNKGPVKEYAIIFNGTKCINAKDIASGWASYFATLYDPLEKEFDDAFKLEMEKLLSQLIKKEVGYHYILDKPFTEDEINGSGVFLREMNLK